MSHPKLTVTVSWTHNKKRKAIRRGKCGKKTCQVRNNTNLPDDDQKRQYVIMKDVNYWEIFDNIKINGMAHDQK